MDGSDRIRVRSVHAVTLPLWLEFQQYLAEYRSSQQRIWVWLHSGAWWKPWFCHSLCCARRNCWVCTYDNFTMFTEHNPHIKIAVTCFHDVHVCYGYPSLQQNCITIFYTSETVVSFLVNVIICMWFCLLHNYCSWDCCYTHRMAGCKWVTI